MPSAKRWRTDTRKRLKQMQTLRKMEETAEPHEGILTTELIEQGRTLLRGVLSVGEALDRFGRTRDEIELAREDAYLDDKLLPEIGKWFTRAIGTVTESDRPKLRKVFGAIEDLPYLGPKSNKIDHEEMRTDVNAIAHHLLCALDLARKARFYHVLMTRRALTRQEAAEVLDCDLKTVYNYTRRRELVVTNNDRITTDSIRWKLDTKDVGKSREKRS